MMVLAPQSNSVSEGEYLGSTSGSLVKHTNIPALIVPDGVVYKKPEIILMAFKNGVFPKKRSLEPLQAIQEIFTPKINLLHVITPETEAKMKKVSGKLKKLSSSYKTSENATTYQGVLEHLHTNNPDWITVVRRKRGFFKKLWEKNVVLKKEFYIKTPLLVLGVQE